MKTNNTIAEVQISYAPSKRKRMQITSSKDAEKCFRSFWNKDISYKESMYILLLNRANIVLGYHLLSLGGTVGTIADVRIIMQLLIKSNAHGFILGHNHPSGNTTPSQADRNLTKQVKEAAELFDVKLLDHLILTKSEYLSMEDKCLI